MLDLMKVDMANFAVSSIRPHLMQQSVEYERSKFQEFLEKQPSNSCSDAGYFLQIGMFLSTFCNFYWAIWIESLPTLTWGFSAFRCLRLHREVAGGLVEMLEG